MNQIGFINVNKPAGITSHGVAQKIKKLTQTRRAGHSGTLDPLATGVLVIALGKATKLVEYLRQDKKTYETVFRLGVTSDTYDISGQVKETPPPVPVPSGAQINSILKQFTGEIEQMPPAFSALKVKGQRAYKLAREGKDVKLEPRKVTIHSMKLLEYRHPFITLEIKCSAGTYIRSIAHDIGQRLKTGAVMEALHRTEAGDFMIENAVDLDALTEENWQEYLLPAKAGLTAMSKEVVSKDNAEKIKRGIAIESSQEYKNEEKIALLDENDDVLAITEYKLEDKVLKPIKVLAPQPSLPPKTEERKAQEAAEREASKKQKEAEKKKEEPKSKEKSIDEK